MQKIRLACETYSWEMASQSYKGNLTHIMDIMQRAGFRGIEAETSFFGELSDPIKMKEALAERDLELAVLCHVEDWRKPTETAEEKANADRWIEFLEHFPDTIYLLVQMPGTDRKHLEERQQNLLACVNAVAERATAKGIECSYHPNSPEGSIYRTEEDYKILLEGLDPRYIAYTPDVGHIAKGGMDPLAICKQYRDRINLIHYKDMFADGHWAPTGEGIIDFSAITNYLVDTDFEGWIIMEDEDDACITDPDGVTLQDGVYIDRYIRPLLP
ncbi:MAG TPA: TIM barrel protein [Saprospiraceae bacterium]|nr:TIM barrel protein [Saprospiraceae bacterium]